jgi:hypothetical protein
MNKRTSLAIAFFLILASFSSVFGQPEMTGPTQEYDSIDARYVEEIYFWPEQGEYIAICVHNFYNGPSAGPPMANDRVQSTEFLLGLVRSTGNLYEKIDATPDWVRANLADHRLGEAVFVDTDYETGVGVVWKIGPHRITSATVKDLPLPFAFYDGFMGDIVYVDGVPITNGSWGYMDHTDQKPRLFKPDPSMNYWLLNSEGMDRYEQKKFAEATGFFLKSLAINPDFQHSNYNLACMYSLLKKQFSEGRQYLEKLLNNPELRAYYLRKIPTDTDFDYWRTLPEFRDWFASKLR